jgi:hypothetical protein
MNYTQQDAKDIIDINTAEENAAFMRLAEKLIQQQDAAVSNPAGIRASIPSKAACSPSNGPWPSSRGPI